MQDTTAQKQVTERIKDVNMSENSKQTQGLGNIEFVQGNEWHSSSWYKFYVKGLEHWQVEEDFAQNLKDRHYKYQGYVCLDIPEDSVFSVFRQDGSKRGTDQFDFWLCRITPDQIGDIRADKIAFCTGNFEIVCHATGMTKAPRLLGWWADNKGLQSLEFARHCAEYITKRGVKHLPPLNAGIKCVNR